MTISHDSGVPPAGSVGDEVRAELLCYLVVAQLVAGVRTGAWLRTDHLVESGLSTSGVVSPEVSK